MEDKYLCTALLESYNSYILTSIQLSDGRNVRLSEPVKDFVEAKPIVSQPRPLFLLSWGHARRAVRRKRVSRLRDY